VSETGEIVAYGLHPILERISPGIILPRFVRVFAKGIHREYGRGYLDLGKEDYGRRTIGYGILTMEQIP
jgi:hypothetical protein